MENINSEFSIYTKNRKLVEGIISLADLSELASLDIDSIEGMLLEDSPNYKYGLSFNEYLYVCFKTMIEFDHLDYYFDYSTLEKLGQISIRYKETLSYVEYIDDALRRNQDIDFPNFEIHPELMDALNKNMDSSYTGAEKIYYYYLKLCILLDPDLIQNFCFFISPYEAEKHFRKSSNRLSIITPTNNEASCFEFDSILTKLIDLNGGVAFYNEFLGNAKHVSTVAIIDKIICGFDAYNPPEDAPEYGRDIINMKNGFGNGGITLDSSSSFFCNLDKWSSIYDVVLEEFKEYRERSKFSDEALANCFDIIDELNLSDLKKEKVKNSFNKMNKLPFSSVVFSGYVLWNDIIEEEDFDWLKLIGVASNFDEFAVNIVCSVQQDDDNFVYFVFGEDDRIRAFNNSEMIELIEANKIIVNKNEDIDYEKDEVIKTRYYFLPGIDFGLQSQMNKVASLELIPLACEKCYLNSLGENDNSYVKKI